ncbi:MAG: hypothetical protein N2255_08655 [Kiritimatiellae bacterium]|nr:hypothetical protein [Kiritimatiellia bacterium]
MRTDRPITVRNARELQQEVWNLFEDFARLVRPHLGNRVWDIWLYGAPAREDWLPDSDVDVLGSTTFAGT